MFAKEYFIEANNDLLAKMDQVAAGGSGTQQAKNQTASEIFMSKVYFNVTEMNLAGSISLDDMEKQSNFTTWKTPPNTDNGLKEPNDFDLN